MSCFDQDEAARSAGEGVARSRDRAREAGPPRRDEGWGHNEGGYRALEKLGLRGGTKAGSLRRGDSGYWRGCGGGTAGTGRAAEAGVHWCIQCVQQAAMLVETC